MIGRDPYFFLSGLKFSFRRDVEVHGRRRQAVIVDPLDNGGG
jgi:hypothetical protein